MTQRENPNTQSMTSVHSSCLCFGLGSCKHLLLRPLDLTIKPAWIMRDVARAAMLSKRFMFCKSTGKKEGKYFSKGKMLIMYVFSKGIVLVEWPSLKGSKESRGSINVYYILLRCLNSLPISDDCFVEKDHAWLPEPLSQAVHTENSNLKIELLATLSVTIYWLHDCRLFEMTPGRKPELSTKLLGRCSLHQKALLWSGRLWKCLLMWARP